MTRDNETAFDSLASHSNASVGFQQLDREGCLDQWTKRFKRPPPRYLSLAFMRKALAFGAQLKDAGNHSSRVRKALKVVRQEAEAPVSSNGERQNNIECRGAAQQNFNSASPHAASSLRAGSHLVREWNGRTHRVEVLEAGFRFDGKDYRSLSAVAKRITGAHWSGPRFFGLSS